MAGYIGASPVPQTIQKKETFTATAGQTTFNTTGYTDGNFINVFLNGVRLVNGTDYTATNGSDIVLATAASASDVLEFETFNEFQLSDQEFADSVIIENNTTEDSDGGRASKLVYKGKQSGGEQSTLAEIQASHDGASDDEAGDLIFRTNDGSDGASPTERMRIDSSGDISFYESTGTTPKFVFDASTESLSLTTVGTEALDISSTTGAAEIRMGNSNSTFDLRFGAADKASGHADFFVETSGSERIRITTDALHFLTSSMGDISASAQEGVSLKKFSGQGVIRVGNTATGGRNCMEFFNGNGQVGTIATSSSATAFNTSSDYRLKENVSDISNGITRIKQLAPKRFNWIADEDNTAIDGFLAHEAQTVVPEAVTGTKDELEVWVDGEELPDGVSVGDNKLDDDGKTIPKMQGIDQAKLVPLLTAALQEAIAKIEILETKVAALEAE